MFIQAPKKKIVTRVIMRMTFVTLCLALVLPGQAEAQAFQDDVRRLESRIDRLEREVKNLQAEIQELQGNQGGNTSGIVRSLQDPLVGTWQCTNNVFNYDITFLADGRLLQESPTFGKVREAAWDRISDDEVLVTGGLKLRTSFASPAHVIIDNLSKQETWDCRK